VVLKIKGIGKIQDSQIEMKGITVIAGENNTGKSTFGKVLYCMFNAFHNTKAAIRDERLDDIRRILYSVPLSEFKPRIADSLSIKIFDEMENTVEELFEDKLRNIIVDAVLEQSLFTTEEDNVIINDLVKNITYSLVISDEKIQRLVINHYFDNEFEGIINHVNKPDSTGNVSMSLTEVPKSCDALYMTSQNEFFLIEFKNGIIDAKKNYEIKVKIFESLLMISEKFSKTTDFIRDSMSFILVYNENVTHGQEQYENTGVRRISSMIFKRARVREIRFGLHRFKKIYFKDVFTYSRAEFESEFVSKYCV